MNRIARILSRGVCAGALLLPCLHARAQADPAPDSKPQAAAPADPDQARRLAVRNRNRELDPFQTFFLKPGGGSNDANEVVTGLRLMLDPSVKIYLLPSINAIVVRGTPEDLALAGKLLADIDRPRKDYRLTYTITESDAGKRIGVQHFALTLVSGGRTTLKNGSKVPVATGSYSSSGTPGQQTQFTYLDVGLNFDATLTEYATGATLRSKVEISSAAEEKLISGVQEPLIRQSVLESTSFLQTGVPVTLGSLDVAGSTRHLDIDVMMEPIR